MCAFVMGIVALSVVSTIQSLSLGVGGDSMLALSNASLAPEPATLIVLAIGSLVVVSRRK